jgi:hypothetical protein
MRIRRSALALAAVAAFAAFARATAENTTCPSGRDNNPPQPFSGMAASSDPPTIVASSGISADLIAKVTEGHQVTINFTGGASPVYAYLIELGGDDAAYASMETSFQSMVGSEATGTLLFNNFVGQWKVATEGFQYKGLGGIACSCLQRKETSAGLYYAPGPDDTNSRIGASAIHEMAHAVQMMKGDQPPVWLIEGGAVHLDCLLNKKLSWSSATYSQMVKSRGGMFSSGLIDGFLAYYASPHGQSHGLKDGEVFNDTTVATINVGATAPHDGQFNAHLLFYHVGAIATAWAIHNANSTTATFWQSETEGFWNAITPWDGYDYEVGYPGDCPEDKGWKKAFLSFSGHDDMDAFYAEFHAWATTATEGDVLAILEPDDDVEVMIAGVFDPQCAMSGTKHDPCGAPTDAAAVADANACWTADASASTASPAASDAASDAASTDEFANQTSSAVGIALGTLGTVLAAAATLGA